MSRWWWIALAIVALLGVLFLATVRCSTTTVLVLAPAPDNRLWRAVKSGSSISELDELLEQSPELAHRSGDGLLMPLHFAIAFERPDLLRLLLDHGADPTATAAATLNEPITPLEYAVTVEDQECLQILLSETNPTDSEVAHCIEIATQRRASAAVVKLLRDYLSSDQPPAPAPLP